MLFIGVLKSDQGVFLGRFMSRNLSLHGEIIDFFYPRHTSRQRTFRSKKSYRELTFYRSRYPKDLAFGHRHDPDTYGTMRTETKRVQRLLIVMKCLRHLHLSTDSECLATQRDQISHLILPLTLYQDVLRFFQVIFLWSRNHTNFDVFDIVWRECSGPMDRCGQSIRDRSKIGMNRRWRVWWDREGDRVVVDT